MRTLKHMCGAWSMGLILSKILLGIGQHLTTILKVAAHLSRYRRSVSTNAADTKDKSTRSVNPLGHELSESQDSHGCIYVITILLEGSPDTSPSDLFRV